MKIEPITPVQTQQAPASSAAQSARDRAIAMLTGQAAKTANAEIPVANPNNVSPEELSVVAPTQKAAEEAPTEAAATPKAEEKSKQEEAPQEQPLSSQYAQLARKEKALLAKINEMKAKEAALAEKEAKLQTPTPIDTSKYISIEDLAKNPVDLLNKAGISYDQLTQSYLNGPPSEVLTLQNTITQLQSEIKKLSEKQEKTEKTFEEQRDSSYKQAVAQLKKDATKLVDSNPDFETIKETGSVEEVVALIEKNYKDTGEILTVEEAAKLVEDHLVEEATKLAKIKKIQSRLQPKQEAKAESPVQKQVTDTKPQNSPTTLSNNMSSSRPMTARERALLAFQGKLAK